MRGKKIRFSTLLISVVLLVSVVATVGFAPDSEANENIVLVNLDGPESVNTLETLDVEILHLYDTSALIQAEDEAIKELRKMELDVNTLPDRSSIYLGSEKFDITEEEPDVPYDLKLDDYEPETSGQYIIHMIGPIASNWRTKLEDRDIQILNYIPNHAYRVRMTPEQAREVSNLEFIDWVGIYHPGYKIQSDIGVGTVNIGLVPDASRQNIDELQNYDQVYSSKELNDGRFIMKAEVNSIETVMEIAENEDVAYITQHVEPELHGEVATQHVGGGSYFFDDEDDDPSTPYRKHGDYGSYMNQIGYTGLRYDGSPIVATVADTGIGDGEVGGGHVDFQDRVIGGYSYTDDGSWEDGHGHGSHCTGSLGADTYHGTEETYEGDYLAAQGSAPDSEMFAVRLFDGGGGWVGPEDTYEIIEVSAENSDSAVHSNSWGAPVDGTYDSRATGFDAGVRDFEMVTTTSAGNSGPGDNTIGSPATAKNVITVGATERYPSNPEDIADFSSRGWTDDNRVKPDVQAPGADIYSTLPTGTGYQGMSGTSMSNPAVAGAAAVTIDWYEENHVDHESPSPAMVKALLINTANPIDGNTRGPIPNQDEGWGMVDISKLQRPREDPVEFFMQDQEHVFTDSLQENEHLIQLDNEDEPLNISLVWTDKEAPEDTGSGRSLINDLNLEVESPGGLTYRGNAFEEGWTQAGEDAMEEFDYSGDGWDDTNNVQNVYIPPDEVEPGLYTVKVEGREIVEDAVGIGEPSQDYALVAHNAIEEIPGEEPEVQINSPDGGEIWDARTEKEISWEAEGGDDPIDRIHLAYSIDAGGSWDIIEMDLPADTVSYNWEVPNVHSDECLVRVRAIDTVGRMGENISTDLFEIVGIIPESPENPLVDHHGEVRTVLFEEDFTDVETGEIPPEWTRSQWPWYVQDTSHAGGEPPELRYEGGEGSRPVRCYTPPIDTEGAREIELSFRHYVESDSDYDYHVAVETSTDGSSWTQIWTEQDNETIPGEEVELSISEEEGAGSDSLYISWSMIGFEWRLSTWNVDDIYLDGLVYDPEGDDNNLITWNLSPDEDIDDISHYNLYRSENRDGPWDESTKLDSIPADSSEVYEYLDEDKGMADDIFWWYVVRSVGVNGREEQNSDAVQEPGDPDAETPVISISRPDSTDIWYAEHEENIEWSTTEGDETIDYIRLWYSENAGDIWNIISYSTDDEGNYNWEVPNVHTSDAMIRGRVVDTAGRWSETESEIFEIVGIPPESPQITSIEHIYERIEVLFEDDVEDGDKGYTTGENDPDASDWDIRQHGSAVGDNSWDWGDGDFEDNGIYLSWLITPEIHIPEEAEAEYGVDFTFQHWYNFGSFDYHGGNVKISTEGIDGPWSLIQPEEGYPGVIDDSRQNPIGGEQGYVGDAGWVDATFDLTDYIGESIHIRWDAGTSDTIFGRDGWRVDDIYMEAFISDLEGDEDNRITFSQSPDEANGDISHYNLYRSEFQDGPWDESTLVDSITADGSEDYRYVDEEKGMADDIYWWYVVRSVGVNGREEENTYAVQEPGGETETFDISMNAGGDASGWNFVSFNLIPTNTGLESILEHSEYGITDNYDRVIYYDISSDEWQSYVPSREDSFNTLDTWDHTMGIWIRVTADDTLTVEGSVPSTTTIGLDPGWNMVGLPSENTGNHDLPTEVSKIGYFDATEDNNVAYDYNPDTFEFEPAKGYWVYNPTDEHIEWIVEY